MVMENQDKNSTEFYYGIGKDGIVKEGIFERFPELIPAVGDHYWREDGAHKKMLLVGESNYFNDNDAPFSDFRDAEKWYKAEDAKLIPDNRKRDVGNYIYYHTFNKVFNIMKIVLSEVEAEYNGQDLLGESAFYNYFLRPADENNGRGFKSVIENIDRAVAGEALTGIIGKLNPELVIFLSKFAWNEFMKFCKRRELSYSNIVIEHVSHPSSIWWNRNGGCYGKMKFENLLKTFWLQEPTVQQ